MSYYCEMCGRELDQKSLKRGVVEGSVLVLCPSCYSRLSKQSSLKDATQQRRYRSPPTRAQQPPKARRQGFEDLEVVDDYSIRIKTARERLGWTQEVLAQKVGESTNTIKRVESGRLKPSIELARRLERVLAIKLVEPVVQESSEVVTRGRDEYLTIGDIISVEESKEK